MVRRAVSPSFGHGLEREFKREQEHSVGAKVNGEELKLKFLDEDEVEALQTGRLILHP